MNWGSWDSPARRQCTTWGSFFFSCLPIVLGTFFVPFFSGVECDYVHIAGLYKKPDLLSWLLGHDHTVFLRGAQGKVPTGPGLPNDGSVHWIIRGHQTTNNRGMSKRAFIFIDAEAGHTEPRTDAL
jgi:hypothetical protein